MKTAPLIIVLVALCGCGEKKKPVGSGDGVRIAPKSAPEVPGTGEEKSSLAEFIRNKRVFVLMEKEGSDEEVFAQFYGNGSYQAGSMLDGVAVSTDEPDKSGKYEVEGLAITIISDDGTEIMLDSSVPEPARGDKLTLTQEDGSQEILLVTRVEEAGIVKVMAPSQGMLVDKTDPGRISPQLGVAAAEAAIGFIAGGDAGSFRAYLARGGDVNGRDKDGNTLVAIASTYGRTEIAKMLIEEEADLDRKNKDGSTALMAAAFLGQVEIVKLLVDAGADASLRNNTNSTALESAQLPWAEAKGWVELLNALIFLPVGQALDMEEVRTGRMAAVEILRNVGD